MRKRQHAVGRPSPASIAVFPGKVFGLSATLLSESWQALVCACITELAWRKLAAAVLKQLINGCVALTCLSCGRGGHIITAVTVVCTRHGSGGGGGVSRGDPRGICL